MLIFFQSMPVAVIIVDQQGVIQFINHKACNLLGVGLKDDVVGSNLGELVKSDALSKPEFIGWSSQVGSRTLSFHITRLNENEGEGYGAIVTVDDGTDEVTAFQLFNIFLHDFLVPLTSILGFSEILIGGFAGTLTDEQHRLITTINENAKRLISLRQELFDDFNKMTGRV